MTQVQLNCLADFETWRREARLLLAAEVPPDLLAPAPPAATEGGTGAAGRRVPAEFLSAGRLVARARDEDRWALLYRLLWRLTRDEPRLLEDVADPDVCRLRSLAKSVSR